MTAPIILKMDIKQVCKDGESQKIYTRQLAKLSQKSCEIRKTVI